MLLIHKPRNHKLLILVITSICNIGALLGLSVLTYTPELSRAETVVLPEPKPDLSTITYMQDITQEICTNTNEADKNGNYQYQLIDKRDNQTYWVAKLKDGNCWMTQNLGYRGYPMGKYVYTTPTKLDACSNFVSLSGCDKHGWVDVSVNMTASTEPNFYIKNGGVVKGKVYDSHYLVGHMYAWSEATNNTGESTAEDQDAIGSVCPAGWILPSGYDNGHFAKLIEGLKIDEIKVPPYYSTPAGHRNGNGHFLAGYSAEYWTSTAGPVYETGGNSYYLRVDTNIGLSKYGTRDFYMSVRCMAFGGERDANNITITAAPTIYLDITNEVIVNKSDANPSTAAFSALVASNQPYSVSISSTNPNMISNTSSTTIPSKSGLLNTNDNAWGIKLSTASTYEQITTTPKLFYSSSSPESKTLPFTIGISTAPDIPNGEYSTDITITATQN